MSYGFAELAFSFGLTLFAGMATAIGSCIAFFFKRTNTRFLAFALGLSGGVMIYISLVELLADARLRLAELYGERAGGLAATAAFFGGIALALLIDKLVPSEENPHEVHRLEEMENNSDHSRRLLRSGTLFALALAIHNFPEGMAVFISSLDNPATGVSIAVAIAIHNIPEGITVSVPIYHATGRRGKAFLWSALSGMAEPLGAAIAWAVLAPFLSATLLSAVFALAAGIMVFITFDELLPLAETCGEHHLAIGGIVSGMLIMALSLIS